MQRHARMFPLASRGVALTALLSLSACHHDDAAAATGDAGALAPRAPARAAAPPSAAPAPPALSGLPERIQAIHAQVHPPCPAGMAFVPTTTFTMGRNQDAPIDRWVADEDTQFANELPDEKPARVVKVAAFCIDLVPVTALEYQACVAGRTCSAVAPAQAAPRKLAPDEAVSVTEPQAVAYCASMGARLPEEPEWELAARGTDGRAYPWGTPTKRHPNDVVPFDAPQVCDKSRSDRPCGIGSSPAGVSPYGLFDMAGTHEEWTGTRFGNEPPENTMFAVRSSEGIPLRARTYARHAVAPDTTLYGIGFRCARAVAEL